MNILSVLALLLQELLKKKSRNLAKLNHALSRMLPQIMNSGTNGLYHNNSKKKGKLKDKILKHCIYRKNCTNQVYCKRHTYLVPLFVIIQRSSS